MQSATLLRSDTRSSAHGYGGTMKRRGTEKGGRAFSGYVSEMRNHHPLRNTRQTPNGTHVGGRELRGTSRDPSVPPPAHIGAPDKSAKDLRHQPPLTEGLSDVSDGTDLDNDGEADAARLALLSSRERIPVGRVAALKMKLERRLERRKQRRAAMQALLEQQEAAAAAAAAEAAKNASPPPVIVRYMTQDEGAASSSERSSAEGDPLDFYFDEVKSQQSSGCDIQHDDHKLEQHLEPSASPVPAVVRGPGDLQLTSISREPTGGCIGEEATGHEGAGQTQRTNVAPLIAYTLAQAGKMVSLESGNAVGSSASPDTGLIQHPDSHFTSPDGTRVTPEAALPTSSGNALRKTFSRTEESLSARGSPPGRVGGAQLQKQSEGSSSSPDPSAYGRDTVGCGRAPVGLAEEGCSAKTASAAHSDPSVALAVLMQGHQAAISSASLRDYFLADFAPKVYGRRAVRTCMSSSAVVAKKPERANVSTPASQPHVLKERGRDLSGPRRVASGCAAFQCLAGGQNATDVGSGPHDKRRSLTSELPASSYPIHHSSAMPLSHAPLSTYNLKDVFLYLRNSVMTSTVPPVSATAGGKGSFRRSRSLFQRPCKGSEQVGTASLGRGSNSCSSGPPLRRHYTDVVGGGKTKCERSRSLRFEESSAELGGQDAIPVMKKDDTTTPSVGILTTSRQASGRNEEGCSSRAPVRNDGKTGDDGGVVSESAGFQKPVEYRAIVKVATKTLAVSENARLQRVCCDRRSSTSGDCQPDSSSVAAPDRPEAAPLFTSTEKKNGPADVAVDSRFSSSATQGEKQVAGEGPRNISTETRKTYKGEEKVPAATSINRPVCVPRLDLTPVSEARNALNPPLKKAYQRPSMDTPCISGFSTDRTSCRSYLQKKERDSEEALGVSPGGRLSRAEARREAREVGGVAYLEQANAGRDIGVRKLVSESKNKEVTDSLEKNPRPECPNPGRTGILVAAAGLPPIPGGRAAGGVLPRIPISSRVVRCNPSLFTARVCTLLAKQLEQEEQCRGDASHRGSRSKTAAKRDSGLEAARSYSSGKTGDPGRWSGAPGKDLLSSASSSKSSSVSRASSSVASVLARSPLQLIEADEGGPQRNRSSASSLRTNSSSQTRSRGSDSGSSGPPHQTNVSTSGSLNHFVVRSGFLDIEPSASLLAHLPVKSAPLNDSVSSPRNADVRSQEENKGTASSCHRDTQLIDTQFWALDMPDGGPRGYCPFEHGNHTRPGSSECSPAATAADLQGQQPALHPSDDGLPLKSARTKSKTRAHGRRVRECGVDAEVTEMAWDVWSAAGPDALGPDGTLLTSDPDILLDARESLQAALFLKPASTTSLSLVDSPSSPQQLRSEATVGHALNLKGSSIKALGSIDLESASDGNRIGIPCQVNSKLRGETICRQKREKSTKHARKELGRSRGRGIGGVPEGSAEDTEGLAFPTDEDSMETEHEITDGFDRRATSRRLRRSGGNATESEAPMRGRAQDRAKSMTEQYALLERRRDNKANNELVDNRGVDDQGSVNNASSPSERARHGQLGGSGQFCEARTRASGSQLASSPVCSADLLDRTSSQDTANNERDMRTAVGAAPQKRRTKRACSPQASSPDNKGKASIIGHSGTENSAREKYRQTSGEGLECNGISTRISSGTTSSTQSRNDSSGFVQNRTSSRHSGSSGPHSSRGGCIGAPRRSVAQPVDWSRVHRGNPAADAKKLSKAESFAYFESDTSTLATRSTTHPVTHSNSTTSTSSTGVHQRANVAAVNATECKGEQWAELENERSVVQRQHHFLGGSAPGGRDGGEYSAGMTSCAACGAGSADACICNSALFDDLGREGGGVFRSRKRHPEGSGGRRLPVQDNSLAGIPSAPVLVVDSNRQSTIAGKEQRNLSSHFIDSSRVCAAPPPTGGRIARSPIRGVIDVDYRSRAPRGRDRSVGTLSIHQTAYDREGFGGGASPRGRRRADSAESFLSRGTTKNTARLRDVVPEATGDHFVQCSRGDDIPTTVAEENRAHGAGLRGDTGERGRKAVHRRDSPSVPAEIRDPSLTADQKLKRSSEGDCGKEGAPHKGRRVLQARWREVQRNAGGPEEGSPNTRVSDGSGAAHYDCLARDTPRRCCKPSARHPMAGKEDAKLTSNALEEAHPFFYRQPRTGAALPTYPSTVSQPQGSRLPRQQQRSGAADFFGPAADDRGRPDGQVAPQASPFNMREIGQNFLTGIHSFLGGAGLGRNERK
ncbi:hypothetical protein CSUI_010866 [Cystoisospora suis]|uniref:Uncharacterized protein n=1 Tax=Cystoisospora suis TaxID=483139 RepID=A0A2C6KG22_9APIC|nr:hypothetical protein CSUI_010866 [Cystoisospora suis]